jgi:hypothetical protein
MNCSRLLEPRLFNAASFTNPSFLPLDTSQLRFVLLGKGILMSTDMPAVLAEQPAEVVAEVPSATGEWAETALTVLFTAAAVLFVSFLAVVTGLV